MYQKEFVAQYTEKYELRMFPWIQITEAEVKALELSNEEAEALQKKSKAERERESRSRR
jgi:regulator of protease activity HflC (stomatin/prohibitin superfamily)